MVADILALGGYWVNSCFCAPTACSLVIAFTLRAEYFREILSISVCKPFWCLVPSTESLSQCPNSNLKLATSGLWLIETLSGMWEQ